jgi:hypothetical protein
LLRTTYRVEASTRRSRRLRRKPRNIRLAVFPLRFAEFALDTAEIVDEIRAQEADIDDSRLDEALRSFFHESLAYQQKLELTREIQWMKHVMEKYRS